MAHASNRGNEYLRFGGVLGRTAKTRTKMAITQWEECVLLKAYLAWVETPVRGCERLDGGKRNGKETSRLSGARCGMEMT